MWKSFAFNKYIWVYIFFCLFNPITNDEKGYLYFTNGSKTWKFTLNDSKNAVALKEKMKSEKSMTLEFEVSNDTEKDDDGNSFIDKLYVIAVALNLALSQLVIQKEFEKYDIVVVSAQGTDALFIVLENKAYDIEGYKIGEIIEGIDEPSDLNYILYSRSISQK